MKKILILILVFTIGAAQADLVSPFPDVRPTLESLLETSEGRKDIKEMKKLANERNTDVDVAFENYLIAKKNVSAARARFNPITTGHVLGISLGWGYLWAPIAAEAILSIPTKIYNVSKSKYLATVANYNLLDARSALNNEMAHLYFDILTHEAILKTIDLELQVVTYQQATWVERKVPQARINDLQKVILKLGMERVDIYSMYTQELAAIKTLISTTDGSKYELAQIPTVLDRSILENIDEEQLQNFAVNNSDKYKASINMQNASEENIKQVKWSILSFEGLNINYKRRIREAKNEKYIAELKRQSTQEEVKNRVLLQLQKFDSSLSLLSSYDSTSEDSLEMYTDTLQSYQMGQLSVDDVAETALNTIRDYRNFIVAHYLSWSVLDDFSTAANHEFQPGVDNENTQNQVELNPLSGLKEESFRINKKTFAGRIVLSLSSPQIGSVYNVTYKFSNKRVANKFSDNGKKNYSVYLVKAKVPRGLSGVAVVKLDNGHEFNVKFNL